MNLQDWVGNQETHLDVVAPTPVRAMAAMLNIDDVPTETLPPLWYWLYFLPLANQSDIGADGHPKRGGFLPPVSLPRRMWAGSGIRFHDDLRVGEAIRKTSVVASVKEKTGKAGTLVFVTVDHRVETDRGIAVEERQDIVYLNMPERFVPAPPNPVPQAVAWREEYPVDPVLLFRFSALTFNGHRIHYDREYAQDLEKYPGLVVHGPLQALLLLEAARRHHPDRRVAGYSFRGTRPIFDHDRLSLCAESTADGLNLFTANSDDDIGTQASVTWHP